MKTLSTSRRRSAKAIRRRQPNAHQYSRSEQKAQQAEIRSLLRPAGIQTKLNDHAANVGHERETDNHTIAVTNDMGKSNQTPHIQRLCSNCGSESTKERDDANAIQAKLSPHSAVSRAPPQSHFNAFTNGGSPLDASARNYFEPRFARNFNQVRVHNDASAADVARKINARAFTMGNNIVFGSGEYQPRTDRGKHLLGHELTHVVQQQAANHAANTGIQRSPLAPENDPATAPSMSCPVANSSPVGDSLDVLFGVSSSTLSSGSIAAVENFVNNWHAAGGTDPVRVDGYASVDGSPDINWPLSCARAERLAGELMSPTRGVPGIPSSSISTFAQGETNVFSNAYAPNRRAQAHIPYLPVSNPLNVPDRRYSVRRRYVYSRGDATILYGLPAAPGLVPPSGFIETPTSYTDYTKQWTNGLGSAVLNSLGGDCGLYARELISRTGRVPESYGTSRPGIGLSSANDLQPGEAYYIVPQGSGAGAVEEDVLSPWNNRVTVRKHLTNFHVAMVVAKDNQTVVTSEVNAAFPGRTQPWFSMYRGNRGFFRTFRREYTRGGVLPGLWRM